MEQIKNTLNSCNPKALTNLETDQYDLSDLHTFDYAAD